MSGSPSCPGCEFGVSRSIPVPAGVPGHGGCCRARQGWAGGAGPRVPAPRWLRHRSSRDRQVRMTPRAPSATRPGGTAATNPAMPVGRAWRRFSVCAALPKLPDSKNFCLCMKHQEPRCPQRSSCHRSWAGVTAVTPGVALLGRR